MQIHSKIVLDIATGEIISRETFEYTGPVALAISAGIGGSGSKSQSKSKSNQMSESGTKFNEDFLNQAFNYFNPANKNPQQAPFDAARYLKENPDVANDRVFSQDPQKHYEMYGKAEGRAYPGDQVDSARYTGPEYNPQYVKGAFSMGNYTPGAYTPVDGGDFNKIESNIYGSQQARLAQAYDANVARQREELSQSGALNSPAQFLEGSARSSLDRSFMENLQQAARDASTTALGLKQQEAARRTGFDVGEATRRTGYDVGQGVARTGFDVGEAGRETQFNEQTQQAILDNFWKKFMAALQSGQFSRGEGSSYGTSSSIGGSGQAQASILK